MNDLVSVSDTPADLYRTSTDAASLCKEIVTKTARTIQGRKYVQVEGWQAIALAHGCTASAGAVERVETGYRAIGKITRMRDGLVIATAEGFVGDDEPTWAKRPEYARRAMAQTRGISRACRSAFAHVVVMIGAGLETTPAEEVADEPRDITPPPPKGKPSESASVRSESRSDHRPVDTDRVETGPVGRAPEHELGKYGDDYVIVDEIGEEFWRGTDLKEGVGELSKLYMQCQSLAMLEQCGSNNAALVVQQFGTDQTEYIRGVYREQLKKLKRG
jgi:hypothetical protein